VATKVKHEGDKVGIGALVCSVSVDALISWKQGVVTTRPEVNLDTIHERAVVLVCLVSK